MQTIRGHADDHIARLDLTAIDNLAAIDHADNETGQIILALRIKARHFRGLATDQGAAVITTATRQTADYRGHRLRIELASTEIIKKVKRLGAMDGNIADAVIDQVFTNGVMDAGLEGNFEFGTNSMTRAVLIRIW